VEALSGQRMSTEYVETNRVGDHICYISDLRRLQRDYPDWDITVSVDDILQSLVVEDAPVQR
jgi:CDP-paratose 2-epimerase